MQLVHDIACSNLDGEVNRRHKHADFQITLEFAKAFDKHHLGGYYTNINNIV